MAPGRRGAGGCLRTGRTACAVPGRALLCPGVGSRVDKCSSLPRLDLVGGISTERSFSFGPFFNVSQVHSHPTIPRPLRLRGRLWGCRSRAVLPWVQLPSPGRTRDSCCLPAPTRVQAEGALSRPRPCRRNRGASAGASPSRAPPLPLPRRTPSALRGLHNPRGCTSSPQSSVSAHGRKRSRRLVDYGFSLLLSLTSPLRCPSPGSEAAPRPAAQELVQGCCPRDDR